MAEEKRFDWPAIMRALAIIVGITAVIGFAVPAAVTVAFKLGNTGRASGHEIYRLAYWAIAWALTVWQGSWMLRTVGERIIDDMLVTSVLAAVALLVVRVIATLVYVPINARGELLPLITAIDAFGALVLVVVAVIAARTNKF